MIELTKYRCDHCGTEYADKQKAQQCEGGHRLPQQIKKANLLPIANDRSGYPNRIIVTMSDGKNIEYVRG